MNSIKWRVQGWYMRMQLIMMKRQVRGLQRKFFTRTRARNRQLELPFRG